ncbi:MAG: hypothetical protein HOZ81_17730, partial [Streptomyces sp.]|nr:hypothetical protein [Streptomyces sp.]
MISAKVRGAVLCAVFLLVSACAGSPPPTGTPQGSDTAAPASSAEGTVDGDVMTSANVKLVANVPRTGPFAGGQNFNTDLAFQGDYAFVGNFAGFVIYDISDPAKPKTVSQVSCPAQQNDVSVHGDLLILSIDEPRGSEGCDSGDGVRAWEGLRLFDISDKKSPRFVGAVRTDCGSHTHTMVPADDKLYVYVSSPGPEPDSETCPAPHENIQIVEIPLDDPKAAKVVAQPNIFPQHQETEMFAGCHDITAYPEKKLAAAACFGDGVLLDISDPV